MTQQQILSVLLSVRGLIDTDEQNPIWKALIESTGELTIRGEQNGFVIRRQGVEQAVRLCDALGFVIVEFVDHLSSWAVKGSSRGRADTLLKDTSSVLQLENQREDVVGQPLPVPSFLQNETETH